MGLAMIRELKIDVLWGIRVTLVLLLLATTSISYAQNPIDRRIVSHGTILDGLTFNGYVVVETDEKVVLKNCDIHVTNDTDRDYQIYINKANANIEIVNTKIHCDNHTVRYGIFAPYQIESLVVKDSEFYGFSEIAINCLNRINHAIIESNEIHDIGTITLKNGKYRRNSIGIRINKNLDDINPNYSLYKGMSVVIKNNVIRNMVSYYTERNDAIEGHGILAYGNDFVIDGNTVENLMAGTTSENLSFFCGSEHEGIYVKGDNCIISNNVLRNACGNNGSEGAIAVKWTGVGGKIVNNHIYQYFGNGIWSQCRGVDISNNQIHYLALPVSADKKIDRFYGIYNYVVMKNHIPVHNATKYVSNIEGNDISYEGVDNLNGFVVSIDNNVDDINISNNSISVDGFVQLFRLGEQDSGKGVKRTVKIQGNNIEKPYPVRNDEFVQQDILIGCRNDQQSILTLSISGNEIRYNRIEKPYKHIGCVLRNYRCDENIHILMNNNTVSLTQYIPQSCFRIEDGVRILDISNNRINANLRRLVDVCNTERVCDISIKKNLFGASIGVVQLANGAKVNNLKFSDNIGVQNVTVTILPTLSSNMSSSYLGKLFVKGNKFKSMRISEGEEYKTFLKGKAIIKNNHF